MEKTLIFGHQKPDTDSVTSSIVLSYLKNQLGENTEPRVLGNINKETAYVLRHFGFKTPNFLNDVRLQIKDVDFTTDCFLKENNSVFDGYNFMKQTKVSIIPIVNESGKYVGMVSMKDIMGDLIDGNLGYLNTSYDNLLHTLNGTEVVRFDKEVNGKIIVPSLRATTIKEHLGFTENDVLIIGDRHHLIEFAIESKVSIIILTNNTEIKEEHLALAKKNKVDIIMTPYDGVTTANLVVLSNYLKNKLMTDEAITVNENDSLFEVLDMANKKKYANYPVLNNKGFCLGIFRANVTNNKHPKKVILVDHNEREQSVIGLDEAEIVEIIDHHKIGNIGTSFPINFRNMPLGCTETILYLMFKENNVPIPKNIAGLMMAGIISDTLLLTSPTTTDVDRKALDELAKIAEEDPEKFGMKMFKAGSSIKDKSISEVIHGDFKNFTIDAQKVGIGQISTMTTSEIMSRKDEFVQTLNEIAQNEDYVAIALFVTDILKNGSYILYNDSSSKIFMEAFDIEDIYQGYFFDEVVSRKKQIVPKIVNYLNNN